MIQLVDYIIQPHSFGKSSTGSVFCTQVPQRIRGGWANAGGWSGNRLHFSRYTGIWNTWHIQSFMAHFPCTVSPFKSPVTDMPCWNSRSAAYTAALCMCCRSFVSGEFFLNFFSNDRLDTPLCSQHCAFHYSSGTQHITYARSSALWRLQPQFAPSLTTVWGAHCYITAVLGKKKKKHPKVHLG